MTLPALEGRGFFRRGERNRFTLRKHLDRVSHGGKSSNENYLSGCNISMCRVAAMLARMNPLTELFLARFYKAVRAYLTGFLALNLEEKHATLEAALL